MKYRQRKPNRLSGYDYRNNGAYFITVCTKGRAPLLGTVVWGDDHIAPYVMLSSCGDVVEKYVSRIAGVVKYAIMPNHIHILLLLDSAQYNTFPVSDGAMWSSPPTECSRCVSQIVKSFKTLVTKEIGFSMFQRSFHDRIIRNEQEYQAIWEYIDTNPQKWDMDCYYSSNDPQ